MQAPLKDKNDIKIFILYLMRNVGYPLDFPNINDIVVQDGFVKYFDFAECFAELIDTGNVREIKSDGETMYEITEQGIQVADDLQSDLMMMIRERSLKSALRLLSFKKRGSRISFSSSERKDGTYDVNCMIIESGDEIFNIALRVDNKKELDRMEYTFRDRPERVYRGILALMTGEADYLFD